MRAPAALKLVSRTTRSGKPRGRAPGRRGQAPGSGRDSERQRWGLAEGGAGPCARGHRSASRRYSRVAAQHRRGFQRGACGLCGRRLRRPGAGQRLKLGRTGPASAQTPGARDLDKRLYLRRPRGRGAKRGCERSTTGCQHSQQCNLANCKCRSWPDHLTWRKRARCPGTGPPAPSEEGVPGGPSPGEPSEEPGKPTEEQGGSSAPIDATLPHAGGADTRIADEHLAAGPADNGPVGDSLVEGGSGQEPGARLLERSERLWRNGNGLLVGGVHRRVAAATRGLFGQRPELLRYARDRRGLAGGTGSLGDLGPDVQWLLDVRPGRSSGQRRIYTERGAHGHKQRAQLAWRGYSQLDLALAVLLDPTSLYSYIDFLAFIPGLGSTFLVDSEADAFFVPTFSSPRRPPTSSHCPRTRRLPCRRPTHGSPFLGGRQQHHTAAKLRRALVSKDRSRATLTVA